MSALRKLLLILITSLSIMGLGACPDQDGPAERTGEKVDETIEDAGEKMEEAGEKAEEAMEEAGEKMEDSVDK